MVRLRKAKRALVKVLSLPATTDLTCHLLDGFVVWTDHRGVNTVIRLNSSEENS